MNPAILAPKPAQPPAPQVQPAGKGDPLRRVGKQVGRYAIAVSVAAAVIRRAAVPERMVLTSRPVLKPYPWVADCR